MSSTPPRKAVELIEDILLRFHETHRRELTEILRLARECESHRTSPGLVDELAAMAEALESHMFKEEMRLFPMMEQGGNTLIGHLIDDMQAEHRAHQAEIARLQALLAVLPVPAAAATTVATLRTAVGKLFADLAEHIRVEDELLFPLFVAPVPARGGD